MPILQDISPVDMEFGTGDIGFRTFLVKNYPASTGRYESRGVLEIHQLKQAFGAGKLYAKTHKEAEAQMEDVNHPMAVMTFPANDPTSLDAVISALTRLRDEAYSYWTVIYRANLGKDLNKNFTLFSTYDAAQENFNALQKITNIPIMIVPIKINSSEVNYDSKTGRRYLKKEYQFTS